MTDTSVKLFTSDMVGAPSYPSAVGSLIAVLDACLATGFGTVTMDSLVVASDLATGTISTGHGFTMVGNTGPVIEISGASPAGLNGQWRLASIADANTFTFAVTGISDQTAGGTIAAKRAPAGWTKKFSATNKAVYERPYPTATAMVLRVQDDTVKDASLVMYESMSDVDTGVGPSSAAENIWANHDLAGSPDWIFYADNHCFYFSSVNYSTNYFANNIFFGDIIPANSADSYHCGLIGNDETGPSGNFFSQQNNDQGSVFARDHSQAGSATKFRRYFHGYQTNMGHTGAPFPNPAGQGLVRAPVNCMDNIPASPSMRGMLPGIFSPIHPYAELTHNQALDDLAGADGKTLLVRRLDTWSKIGAIVIDITGPWR